MKQQSRLKLFAAFSAAVLAVSAMQIPTMTAVAEDNAPFPYVLYASAQAEDAITIEAQGTWVNGNIAADGGILAEGDLTVSQR